MMRAAYFVCISLLFLSRIVFASDDTSARKDIEYLISVKSVSVSKEIKEKEKRINSRIINNPKKYIPVLKEITALDNLKKGKKYRSSLYRYNRGVSMLACIDNKESLGILKQRYLELANWEKHVKTAKNENWYKKASDIMSTRVNILSSLSLYKNASLWDLCLDELKVIYDKRAWGTSMPHNILNYLGATVDTYTKKMDEKSIANSLNKIKAIFLITPDRPERLNKVDPIVKKIVLALSGQKDSDHKEQINETKRKNGSASSKTKHNDKKKAIKGKKGWLSLSYP